MLNISRNISQILTRIVLSNTNSIAGIHTIQSHCCTTQQPTESDIKPAESHGGAKSELTAAELKRMKNDRSQAIPVETSMRYLKSAAYQQTYGEQAVWVQYRRNHLGMFPPRHTRKTCVRKGVISTGNPCPICRDEYLVLDYRNLDLLKQFISAQTGKVLSYSKTGLCQKKHLELLVAVEKARDYGLLTFDVPFREFDYSEYYKQQTKQQQ